MASSATEETLAPALNLDDFFDAQLPFPSGWLDFPSPFCQDTPVPQDRDAFGNAVFSSHYPGSQPSPLTQSTPCGSSNDLPSSANTDEPSPSQLWVSDETDLFDNNFTVHLLNTDSKTHVENYDLMDPDHTGHSSSAPYQWQQHTTGGADNQTANHNAWLAPSETSVRTVADSNASQLYHETAERPSAMPTHEMNYQLMPDYAMTAQPSGTIGPPAGSQAANVPFPTPTFTSWSGFPADTAHGMHYTQQTGQPRGMTPLAIPSSQATTRAISNHADSGYYMQPQTSISATRDHQPPTWQSNEPWTPINLQSTTEIQQPTNQSLINPKQPASARPVTKSPKSFRPSSPTASSRRPPRAVKRGHATSSSSSNRSRSPAKRGGRKKGYRLRDETRAKSAKMRGHACWGCALQRDACDDDHADGTCNRCRLSLQRTGITTARIIGCDRREINIFISYFLPGSMTEMSSRDDITGFMAERVHQWIPSTSNGFSVPLNCACGPTIDWVYMHEFVPWDQDSHFVLQYDEIGLQAKQVRSPCLALKTMYFQSENLQFERFLDLVVDQHLDQFAAKFYEKEYNFPKAALRLLCELFRNTTPRRDKELYTCLRQVLRMLVATHIMGTTFSIPEPHRTVVIKRLQQTGHESEFGQYMSPRVATAQLKFYFNNIRNAVFVQILGWLQRTFKWSGSKDQSWVWLFCALLGLAMVLEDCQQLIHIRADARIRRGQRDPQTARYEAATECRVIDNEFEFLINLFHCKYRKRNILYAKLSEYIDTRDEDTPDARFIRGLQDLTAQEGELNPFDIPATLLIKTSPLAAFLRHRSGLTIPLENGCQYTSRLVARLLDNFMGVRLSSPSRVAMVHQR